MAEVTSVAPSSRATGVTVKGLHQYRELREGYLNPWVVTRLAFSESDFTPSSIWRENSGDALTVGLKKPQHGRGVQPHGQPPDAIVGAIGEVTGRARRLGTAHYYTTPCAAEISFDNGVGF